MQENVQEEVKEAMIDGADLPPAETIEDESSKEVKTEEVAEAKSEEPAVAETPVVETPSQPIEKESEINKNLNIALQKERDAKKSLEEKISKLEETSNVVNKMRDVFSPKVEEPTEEEKRFLTEEEVEKIIERREYEKNEIIQKQKQKETIDKEIEDLSKKWDGKEWKPKYDDSKVLEWQQKNSKLYLSPTNAFNEMKYNEIIDYEVKKRLSWVKETPTSEKPSWVSVDHSVDEKTPKSGQELKNLVANAMSSASADL